MRERDGYLVVGGDSLVGGETLRALRGRGRLAFGTTRRPQTVDGDRILLDFERPETWQVPDHIGRALVIAAATNYDRCATDPLARTINVELIPALVRSLLEQGLHVTFISTNSVFGGEQPWPAEDAPHRPGIPYAEQKSLGEAAIREAAGRLGALDRLAIVRLTKILTADVSPLPAWRAAWSKGEVVEPFEDLIFAPMSARFCAAGLATIAETRPSGALHLSGAENVSYVRLAQTLARRFGVDDALIRPTTSKAKGVHIAFLPTYSGLGMQRTTEFTGLRPQPLDSVIDDIFPKDSAA
jgi:dTDP-4-dehydrorhamnose reductase